MSDGHNHKVQGQNVVLDVGGDIGALVIYVPAELNGMEIEIRVPGADDAITHTEVHPRRVLGGHVHAGVFPELASGEYELRPPRGTAGTIVMIEGGRIAELDWR